MRPIPWISPSTQIMLWDKLRIIGTFLLLVSGPILAAFVATKLGLNYTFAEALAIAALVEIAWLLVKGKDRERYQNQRIAELEATLRDLQGDRSSQ